MFSTVSSIWIRQEDWSTIQNTKTAPLQTFFLSLYHMLVYNTILICFWTFPANCEMRFSGFERDAIRRMRTQFSLLQQWRQCILSLSPSFSLSVPIPVSTTPRLCTTIHVIWYWEGHTSQYPQEQNTNICNAESALVHHVSHIFSVHTEFTPARCVTLINVVQRKHNQWDKNLQVSKKCLIINQSKLFGCEWPFFSLYSTHPFSWRF